MHSVTCLTGQADELGKSQSGGGVHMDWGAGRGTCRGVLTDAVFRNRRAKSL